MHTFHICFLSQTACFSLRPICHLPFGQSATCPSPHRSCSAFLYQLDFFHVHISYLFPLSDCMRRTASCCDEKMLLVWFSQVPQLTWFTRGSENLTSLVWFGKDAQSRARASPCFFSFVDFGLWIISDCVRCMPMLVPNQTMPHCMSYFVIGCPEPNQPRTILQATKHGLRASYTKPNQTILHISH